MSSKNQWKLITCGFESPSWTLVFNDTSCDLCLSNKDINDLFALYAVTSTWSGFSLSFKRDSYERFLSISSVSFHETCGNLTFLTSLAWHEMRFILITTLKSYWEHMRAHTGLLCVASIGNWAKRRPPVFGFFYRILVLTSWMAFHQRAAGSEPLTAAKAGPQRWGQMWTSGIRNHPVYPGGALRVPHIGFRATKPYSENKFLEQSRSESSFKAVWFSFIIALLRWHLWQMTHRIMSWWQSI